MSIAGITAMGFELCEGEMRPSQRHWEQFADYAKPKIHAKSLKELEAFIWLTPTFARHPETNLLYLYPPHGPLEARNQDPGRNNGCLSGGSATRNTYIYEYVHA